jgi:hypothetical protein
MKLQNVGQLTFVIFVKLPFGTSNIKRLLCQLQFWSRVVRMSDEIWIVHPPWKVTVFEDDSMFVTIVPNHLTDFNISTTTKSCYIWQKQYSCIFALNIHESGIECSGKFPSINATILPKDWIHGQLVFKFFVSFTKLFNNAVAPVVSISRSEFNNCRIYFLFFCCTIKFNFSAYVL